MSIPGPLVLVVEDEMQIRRFVRAALEGEGYRVAEAETMAQGLIDAGTRKPDLLILDLGLPDGDGVRFVHDLRTWSNLPVLILSARSTENDKIGVLDEGADDYLTKPFAVGELLARVRALLRRGSHPAKSFAAR
jgi:two-component system, OmpR family, KDP operon response regulator KdpE